MKKDRPANIHHLLILLLTLFGFWGTSLPITAAQRSAKNSPQLQLNQAEQNWLKQHPKIRVGMMDAWPPIAYQAHGRPAGIDAALIQLINRRLGGVLRTFPAPFKTNYDKVVGKSLDAVMDITPKPERDANFNFTKSYLKIPHVIIGKKEGAYFAKESDLDGRTLALEKGFGSVKYFRENFPHIKIRQYKNTSLCLDAVIRGEADAYAGNRAAAMYIIRQELISSLKVHGRLQKRESVLAIGVRKDWPELASILNQTIDSITNAEWNDILQSWTQKAAVQDTIYGRLTVEEKKWLAEHPVIRVQNETDWAPINFNRGGKPSGFSIDVIKALAEKVNLRVKFVHGYSWDGFIDLVKRGDLDVMMNIVKSPEREKFLNFTSPYFSFSQALFTRTEFPPVHSIRDLFGKTFAVPKGFYVEDLLKNYPQVKLLTVKDTSEAITAVSSGRADALLDVMPVVNYLTRELLVTNLKAGGTLGFKKNKPFDLSIGVRKDWKPLRDILQKTLMTLSEREMHELRNRWFFTQIQQEKGWQLDLTLQEKAWLADHPTIRVSNEFDYPPFDFFENGRPSGFSIDYLNLLADMLGIQIKYVTGPTWQEFLGMIRDKDLDVMLNIVRTADRRKYLLFTSPYINNPNVIVSRTEQYHSLDELKGRTVAVPEGFFHAEILAKKYPEINLHLVDNVLTALKAVSFGTADASLGEKAVVETIIQRNMLNGLRISGELDIGNPDLSRLRIGIRNDWPLLQSALMKAMSRVTPRQMEKIQKKWILPALSLDNALSGEKEAVFSNRYLPPLIGIMAAIFLLILLIVWIVSRARKRDFTELYYSSELRWIGLAIITLSIGIIILLATYRTIRFKQDIKQEVENRLEIVLKTSHQMLELWVNSRKRELQSVLRDPYLVKQVHELLRTPRNQKSLLSSPAQKALRYYFKQKSALLGVSEKIRYHVVAPDMTTIGSPFNPAVGRKEMAAIQRKNRFNSAFLGEIVMVPPVSAKLIGSDQPKKEIREKPVLFFAGPVKDQDGLTIAVIAISLDPLADLSRIVQTGRPGKSGESYLFDNSGLMLTESRFRESLQQIGLIGPKEHGLLKIRLLDPGISLLKKRPDKPDLTSAPLTRMAQAAVSGINGNNVDGYRDYRGIRVVGAWLWDHHLDVGMATEIDWDEAFSQYVLMRNTLVTTLGVTILIALFLTGFALWIGQSANRSLTTSRDELEIRVEERTAELTRLEKRFRDLLESAPDSMIIVNDKGNIVIVNAQTEDLFGYCREEIIGQPIEIVIPHQYRQNHPDKRNRFIQDSQTNPVKITRKLIALSKSGDEFPVEVSLSPLETDEGLMVSAAVRDITERILAEEALKESEEKNRLILNAVGEGIFGVDLEGKTMFINPAACQILGYEESELLGRAIHEAIHHTRKNGTVYPVDECPMKKAYVDGRTFHVDDEVLWLKDGTPIDVVYTSTPIIKGRQIVGSVVTFRDVTEKRKAEERLQFTQASVDHSVDAVLWVNIDSGHFTYVNQTASDLLGYTRDELLSLKVPDIDHRFQFDQFAELVADLKEKSSLAFESELKCKDGSMIDVEISLNLVEHLKSQLMVANARDITERKATQRELTEKEGFLRSFIDNSRALIYAKDLEGRYILVSKSWPEILGFGDIEPLGRDDYELFGPEIAPDLIKNDRMVIETKKSIELEELVTVADKTTRTYYSTKFPLLDADNKVYAVCGVSTDISEIKRMGEELQVAKEKAEEATRAKSDFLANMSHEIRTPMNAIMGLTHLCLQTELDKKQQDYLTKVHNAAISLLGLINDILDFSKIEAGKLDMESIDFNLDDVLSNVSTLVAIKAQEKGLEFLFKIPQEVPRHLVGDPLRIGQVLINLANNAVKFTEEGEIIILTDLVEQTDEMAKIRFTVRDTGIGLTEEQIGRLFQSFSQADSSTTRKYGGTGLGLTISKRLVELMNGSIEVSSTPGEGSSFIFTAEFRRQSSNQLDEQIVIPDLKDTRTLVVDDNAMSREIFTSLLQGFQFAVEEARNGKDALNRIDKAEPPFQLIILDWKMPGMDGIKVAEEIRKAMDPGRQPKIILATAFDREEARTQAGELHIDGFLNKPVTPSSLYDAVLKVFGRRIDVKSEVRRSRIDKSSLRPILGARILLAEDNEINQQVAQELLEGAGFVVEVAENGRIAMEKLATAEFDVILMDIQMPVMDGYAATHAIREKPEYRDMPILAMTASATVDDRERALKEGLNDHIAKPIDPNQLFATLLKWIEPGDRPIPVISEDLNEDAETEEISIPDRVDGIDLGTGLERIGGNKRNYLKLLDKFSKNQQSALSKINGALENNDIELATRLAHTLKGVSGNIGAMELHEAAKTLEVEIREKGSEASTAFFSDTQARLEEVLSSVHSLIKDPGDTGSQTANAGREEIIPLINELRELAENDDTDALAILEKMLPMISDDAVLDALQSVEEALNGYDFEEALEYLAKAEDLLG